MSVYVRFKRSPEGFRQLVELLETTPASRRKKMIDVGMAEDPVYTQRALEFMLTFEDLVKLPDIELAELVAMAPARSIAYALGASPDDVQKRFMRNAQAVKMGEIKDLLGVKVGPREISGAQIKLVEIARQLERKGLIRAKRIPLGSLA